MLATLLFKIRPMPVIQDSDNNASYELLNLFQPPTAHRAVFERALENVIGKVDSLIPRFGLRNPRISIPETYQYSFCIPDEWVGGQFLDWTVVVGVFTHWATPV